MISSFPCGAEIRKVPVRGIFSHKYACKEHYHERNTRDRYYGTPGIHLHVLESHLMDNLRVSHTS